MYGDLAGKLIQDAKRSQSLETLPLYLEDTVRGVVREIRDLDRAIEETMEQIGSDVQLSQDRKTSCALFVQHLCMRRNKRCLLAYQRLRANRMREMAWREVDASERGVMVNLNPNEQEYWRQFSELLADYKGAWTEIDLTGSLEPPRDLFIDVRVLKDAGEIQTEYGYDRNRLFVLFFLGAPPPDPRSSCFAVEATTLANPRVFNLTKNSQFFVRQADVQRLIQQGYLQKISPTSSTL